MKKITNKQLNNIQVRIDRTEKYNELVNMKNTTLLQLHNERLLYNEKLAVIQKLAEDLDNEFVSIDIIEVLLGKINNKITNHSEYEDPMLAQDDEDIWADDLDDE